MIQWTPPGSPIPFYVHVAFNSKELFEDAVNDEGGRVASVFNESSTVPLGESISIHLFYERGPTVTGHFDLFAAHSTYFITRYVIVDPVSMDPASPSDLKLFSSVLDESRDANHSKKLETFWSTSKAHELCMELIFTRGDYTQPYQRFHREPLRERAPFEAQGDLDLREVNVDDQPIDGFFEVLILGPSPTIT